LKIGYGFRMRPLAAAVAAGLALLLAPAALGSPAVQYGIQDDAWLATGPGTLEQRLDKLDSLGVDVVRYSVRWNEVERARGSFDWTLTDAVLQGLHAHGIAPVVTLVGTPAWANGGRGPNWAPSSAATFAAFARAAAMRYPWVRDWTIWNEPNQVINLRPTTPATYVTRLLNPGYRAIHAVLPRAVVAGGMTAPRAGPTGVAPLAWIRGMAVAGALLDVYAHHPYPGSRLETPFGNGCHGCSAITLANLPVLVAAVDKYFGPKRIWLTEFAYQTNPPDTFLGVPPGRQAALIGEAALRAFQLPRVDMLIWFLYQDEPATGNWQSGLVSVTGKPKPALRAFPLPVAEVARSGARATLWGQVRPGKGPQRYRLEELRGGSWRAVGGWYTTTSRGFFQRVVAAPRGAQFRVLSPAAASTAPPLALRLR
jgi:hypothetical protein